MALYDFRRLIELYPFGAAAAIEVTEPGKVSFTAIHDDGSVVCLSLSAGDAGVILDTLSAAIMAAEGLNPDGDHSSVTAESISDGLLYLRNRVAERKALAGLQAPHPSTGVEPLEPPC